MASKTGGGVGTNQYQVKGTSTGNGTAAGPARAASLDEPAGDEYTAAGFDQWEAASWQEHGFTANDADGWAHIGGFSAAEARKLTDAGVSDIVADGYASLYGIRQVDAIIAWHKSGVGVHGAGELVAAGSPGPRATPGEIPAGTRRPLGHLSDLATDNTATQIPYGEVVVPSRRWDGRKVSVDVCVQQGLPDFDVNVLSGQQVREVRDRVRAAILSAGFRWPNGRITVNPRPRERDFPTDVLDTRGDAAIAVGVLMASNQIAADLEWGDEIWGQLGLDGRVTDIEGI
jgi:hypothetical protein